MAIKRLKHKEVKWLSIHNLDAINSYLKEGWQLESIHYLDPEYSKGNRIVPSGYYSQSVRVRFVRSAE